jgi:hypothetical protein
MTTAPVAESAHAPAAAQTISTALSEPIKMYAPRRKRGRPERFTPDQVIEALEAASGVKKVAAELLQTSGPVIGGYIKRHVSVREAFDRIIASYTNAN